MMYMQKAYYAIILHIFTKSANILFISLISNHITLLMKKVRHLCMALLTAIGATLTAGAEQVSPYTVDFNTPITTSDHAFKVAPNWKHIVGKYTDAWGDTYYMSYSYRGAGGRPDDAGNNTGALYISSQTAGESYYDQSAVTDVLVTPVVSGDVTIYVNADSYSSSMTIYNINDDGTLGDQIVKYVNNGSDPATALSTSEWIAVTIHLDAPARIGYRGDRVAVDDFSATTATIEAEPGMTLESVVPTETSGTKYWDQLPDGSVEMRYTVTVTNNGQTVLTPGQKNYSVSIVNTNTNQALGTTPVPQTLAIGETSEPFDVVATITDVTSVWPYTYSSLKVAVRENLNGTSVKRADSSYNEYKSKFVFRAGGTSSTSSISTSTQQAFGIISEPLSKTYEIYNDGAAPLTVKSVTVPEGFTAEGIPAGEFTVAKKDKLDLTITQPATATGTFVGDLVIVYDNNGTETTYTLPFSASVITPGTWVADFNNTVSKPKWPEGSVAESGVAYEYNYSSGQYELYLQSYSSSGYATENNKFITPKLHAEAGDVMSFDLAYEANNSPEQGLKIYLSTDRVNWGEPVAEFPCSTLTSSFQTKTMTIPEAGDYYVAFALWRVKLDNIVGLKKVEGIDRDIYFKTVDVPDEVQSGKVISPAVEIIPVTGLTAADYSVKFYVDGQALATANSVDLEATAKDVKRFYLSDAWTPEVETNTTFNAYFQFEFTDGETVKSPEKQVKVTYEPWFAFFDKGTSTGAYNPTSRTAAIDFGRVNELGLKQEFEIYNHGMAPLTVSSITVPDGFTASVTEATVAAKERQQVDITFSATDPGTYSGNLSIVWVDGNGENQTYTLEVKGDLLDTTKWYASFDDGSTTGAWPLGSLYQSSVSTSDGGTYSAPDCYATCYGSSDNMLISPKLHAEAGETLTFNGRVYSSGWSEGSISIFAAPTRDDLQNEETRTLLGSLSGDTDDEASKMTDSWQTYTVAVPEAGDWYLGFAISNRAQLDEIYGLTVCDVAHDWMLEETTIPETAMQNKLITASLKLRNIGLRAEEAGAYTITAFVNGNPCLTADTPELAAEHSLTKALSPVEFTFRSPKVGTFPVYVQVTAGDYTVVSEPVEVTFTEETVSSELVVGTPAYVSNGNPDTTMKGLFNFYDKNSTGVVLYTPADLGLNGGEKITQIKFRGRVNGDITENYSMYFELTDDTEQAQPEPGEYDVTGMTQILDWPAHQWTAAGSESDPVDVVVADLAEPIVYEAGKSIRIVTRGTSDKYTRTHLLASTSTANNWGHSNDNRSTYESQAWTSDKLPVMYLSIAVDPVTLSGNVTYADGTPAEGAVVLLVSDDTDDVQYETLTDAEGNYEVNVIQHTRPYSVNATKDDLRDYLDEPVTFEESRTADFTLMLTQHITNDNPAFVPTPATILTVDMQWPAGVNTVSLPFALTRDEALNLFGADALIHTLGSDDGEGTNPIPTAMFDLHEGDLEAGVPYLVYLSEPAESHFFAKGIELIGQPGMTETATLRFTGVFEQTPVETGMYVLDGCKVLTDDQTPTGDPANNPTATEVAPFHAYLSAADGVELQGLHFRTASGLRDDFGYTGIGSVTADQLGGNAIYNLQGVRVTNPSTGVYIVNGRKIYIRK